MCIVFLLWIVAGTAQRVGAADLELDWIAPPACPTLHDVKARVLDQMASSVPANLSALIEVTRVESGYRADVVLRSRAGFGKRRLEHPQCDVLADSVAVLIALSSPTQPSSARERGLALTLSPEGRVLAGSLPALAVGVGATIALEGLSALRLELQAGYYLPQSTSFEQSAIGGNFQLLTLGLCIGRLWSIGRVHWGPCLGVQVHHVSARGVGGMTQWAGSTSWWGPALRLLGRVQLWPVLSINVAVEGMLPVFRPEFVFVNVGEELHRVDVLALQVSVGPEVRF
jgi:hypothetical protein